MGWGMGGGAGFGREEWARVGKRKGKKGRKADRVSKGTARRAGSKSQGATLLSLPTPHLFSLPPRPEIKTSPLPAPRSAVPMPRARPPRRPPHATQRLPHLAGGRAEGRAHKRPSLRKSTQRSITRRSSCTFLMPTSLRSPFGPCHRRGPVSGHYCPPAASSR